MPYSLKIENAGYLALVLVTVVFITSRLSMPLIIDGSYVDEY
jgi:hypothetical protein